MRNAGRHVEPRGMSAPHTPERPPAGGRADAGCAPAPCRRSRPIPGRRRSSSSRGSRAPCHRTSRSSTNARRRVEGGATLTALKVVDRRTGEIHSVYSDWRRHRRWCGPAERHGDGRRPARRSLQRKADAPLRAAMAAESQAGTLPVAIWTEHRSRAGGGRGPRDAPRGRPGSAGAHSTGPSSSRARCAPSSGRHAVPCTPRRPICFASRSRPPAGPSPMRAPPRRSYSQTCRRPAWTLSRARPDVIEHRSRRYVGHADVQRRPDRPGELDERRGRPGQWDPGRGRRVPERPEHRRHERTGRQVLQHHRIAGIRHRRRRSSDLGRGSGCEPERDVSPASRRARTS